MGKRQRVLDGQLGFAFEPPAPASAPGELAGLEALISGAVATILVGAHAEGRHRGLIAAEMSVLLGEEVSRAMLDAYASPAREGHKVPMSRFLALIAVTNRHDVLDRILREIGAAVLVGEEVNTALLGSIDRQIAKLKAERQVVERRAPIIRGTRQP